MATVPEIDSAPRAADDWVDDLMQRLGWRDKKRVYLALIAALHALRDALPRDEAVFLGAQLPALLRGFYYEGWHPSAQPATRSRSAFLARIHDGLHRDPGVDAEQVARCSLALLAARLPAPELEDAKAATPSELHNLWPS
jgi:uncharacterized protein (DUF2267 family)